MSVINVNQVVFTRCKDCGMELDYSVKSYNTNDITVMRVSPCPNCMDVDGYREDIAVAEQDGYNRGYRCGFEEGLFA